MADENVVAFDPFGTKSEGGYSVEKFYTRSTDKQKADHTARIAIPADEANEIAAIVASRRFPNYRTAADLYRDAIHHRLHWLCEQEDNPRLKSKLAAWQRQIEAQITLEEINTWEETVKIQSQLIQKDKFRRGQLVAEARMWLEDIPRGTSAETALRNLLGEYDG